jgi:glycosyltransferase involved in cell wall biosynthesis
MGLGHRFGEFLAAAERTAGLADVTWAYAAGGRRLPEVKSFAAAHPDAKIEILPDVPVAQLLAHLCSADVHLVSLEPSWQGCMIPSKLQSSFAVGRPAIFVGARENSITRWIEESGGGWVVPPDDVDALTAAVREAREPGERARRGRAARAYAEAHFDMDTNRSRMCDWLEGAVRDA